MYGRVKLRGINLLQPSELVLSEPERIDIRLWRRCLLKAQFMKQMLLVEFESLFELYVSPYSTVETIAGLMVGALPIDNATCVEVFGELNTSAQNCKATCYIGSFWALPRFIEEELAFFEFKLAFYPHTRRRMRWHDRCIEKAISD
jgi:hypothetical protein